MAYDIDAQSKADCTAGTGDPPALFAER